MTWTWDETAYNYIDENGDYMDREYALDLAYSDIEDNDDDIEILAELLVLGLITLAAWIIAMQIVIKEEYIRLYLLAIGGEGQMTQEDWDILAEFLDEQYSYLENFADEIAAGIVALTIAAIAARAMLYLYSAIQAFWEALTRLAKKFGAKEEKWLTRGDKNCCEDCIAFENMGWQPIGTFPIPGSGKTRCLGSCRCHKQFRNAQGIIF